MMITSEERREIAARLRRFKTSDVSGCFQYLEKLDEIIGINDCEDTGERLADLIEPEPERTCRNMADEYDGLEFVCSECTRAISEYEYAPEIGEFCPSCGAKVVEND